jgi:hypothetical protein
MTLVRQIHVLPEAQISTYEAGVVAFLHELNYLLATCLGSFHVVSADGIQTGSVPVPARTLCTRIVTVRYMCRPSSEQMTIREARAHMVAVRLAATGGRDVEVAFWDRLLNIPELRGQLRREVMVRDGDMGGPSDLDGINPHRRAPAE